MKPNAIFAAFRPRDIERTPCFIMLCNTLCCYVMHHDVWKISTRHLVRSCDVTRAPCVVMYHVIVTAEISAGTLGPVKENTDRKFRQVVMTTKIPVGFDTVTLIWSR